MKAQSTEGHAMLFEMCEHPWRGAILIFDDGVAELHRHRLSPDHPVLVQIEGLTPTPEQIDVCRALWTELYAAMDFRVASFCPKFLPFCHDIMAPSNLEMHA
jgi:hypothetical protein